MRACLCQLFGIPNSRIYVRSSQTLSYGCVYGVSAQDDDQRVMYYTYLLTCLFHGAESFFGLQLVKKFPAFHGTRRFTTALTSVRHLSLSWTSPIHSIYPHPTSWRSILILSTHLHLGLPSGLLPFPHLFLLIILQRAL